MIANEHRLRHSYYKRGFQNWQLPTVSRGNTGFWRVPTQRGGWGWGWWNIRSNIKLFSGKWRVSIPHTNEEISADQQVKHFYFNLHVEPSQNQTRIAIRMQYPPKI